MANEMNARTEVTRIKYNEAEEKRLLNGPVLSDLERRGGHVATVARSRARKRTGRMAREINVKKRLTPEGQVAVDVISPAEYSIYVEYGTYRTDAHPFLIPALEAIEHE